jgi:BMFP domain-containing protein YqiC
MKTGPDAKIFDDIARMAGGAVNMFSGLQQQIQSDIKSRFDELASRLDLVPREDLERAEARIAKLEKSVAALNEKMGVAPAKTKAKAAKKPAVPKKKKTKADA